MNEAPEVREHSEASISTIQSRNIDMTNLAINQTFCTIMVPFHGVSLFVVNRNGEPFTPMKPIVEGMGMDWMGQFTKLKQRFKSTIEEISIVAADGKSRPMICLALRKLNGWLQTISPNKVRPEIRDKVIQYQEECDDVLYKYWVEGMAVNPRRPVGRPRKNRDGMLTVEQQQAIKELVVTRGKSVPSEYQAKATITLWSALKSHFGCSYKDIDSEKFVEALSIAARVPLEGEFIGREKPTDKPALFHNLKDGNWVIGVKDGQIVESKAMRDGERVISYQTFKEIAERTGDIVISYKTLIAMSAQEIVQLSSEAEKLFRYWEADSRERSRHKWN